jgi:general secretion pathway protein E
MTAGGEAVAAGAGHSAAYRPIVRSPFLMALRGVSASSLASDGEPSGDCHAGRVAIQVCLLELRRHLARSFEVQLCRGSAFRQASVGTLCDGRPARRPWPRIAGDGRGRAGYARHRSAQRRRSARHRRRCAGDPPDQRHHRRCGAHRRVSDIHIEPYETGLVVRMRVDGVLRETLRMPPHVAPVVVSRIKVMARLDIAERRVPQDGRIGLTLGRKAAGRPRLDPAEPGGRARGAAHPGQGECRVSRWTCWA